MGTTRPLLIYVAGPYTADSWEGVHANVKQACEAGRLLMHLGHHPVVPHSMYMGWDLADPKLTYEHFIKADLDLLSRCDALVMLPGWEDSPGSCGEYTEALERGLRIYLNLVEVPLAGSDDAVPALILPAPAADPGGDVYLKAFNVLSQRYDVLRARIADLRNYPRISGQLQDVLQDYEAEAQSCHAAMRLLGTNQVQEQPHV